VPSPSLTTANIESVGRPGQLQYECLTCGQFWSPNIQSGGRRPRGWWRCPKGCNADAVHSATTAGGLGW